MSERQVCPAPIETSAFTITSATSTATIPNNTTNKHVGNSRSRRIHDPSRQERPPHHGSSSTTLSTSSSLSTSTGGACGDDDLRAIGSDLPLEAYYSSAAESSGVATMSSLDNLPRNAARKGEGTTGELSTAFTDNDSDEDDDENGERSNTLKAVNNRGVLEWDLGLAEGPVTMNSLQLSSFPASASAAPGPSSAPVGSGADAIGTSLSRAASSRSTDAAVLEQESRNATKIHKLPPAVVTALSIASGGSTVLVHHPQPVLHQSPPSSQPPPLASVALTCANSCSQIICTPLRTMVSQNRRRYQQDGFNLDLTYITDRIIAMGYPADTKEALYRNSMSHIVRFLEHYHPGHYKVFNLRGQYVYDVSRFHNRVVSFEMTDHHPPRLELMAPFCREVDEYLSADPRNVVAVHCKAGKGRTGVMICAYLCYIAFYKSPRQNMDYYSIVRTHNNKGVTIPSQRRYVYYFSHLRERRLNYMPLRVELVGVYVERPPKLSGTFSKGALKVRVANGDVDVFLGDNLWISAEKSEEEDEMYRKHPVMIGEDQYDPYSPQGGKDCISRRCYGWTVPPNRRVFLEGDVRVDIFQKRVLPVLNLKQEKKKIGHIWFNTMFCCPGFCGGVYTHGDEAYPYTNGESMIVQRRPRRRSPPTQENLVKVPTAPEFNTSSIVSDQHRQHNEEEVWQQSGSAQGSLVHLQKHSKHSPRSALRFNSGGASNNSKRGEYFPHHHNLVESERKGWSSQDGDFHLANGGRKGRICRSSLDNNAATRGGLQGEAGNSMDLDGGREEEELFVPQPPGLDAHCPLSTLKEIYSNEKQAPRYGIVDMLKDAYQRNLLNDLYNVRRLSAPKEGNLMPKSPEGRPNADGPYCVMRTQAEHVGIYSAQEIDGAHKSKEVDSGYFKLYIVTRCVDERNIADVRLADSFLRITYQRQMRKDEIKREKLESRQKKLSTQPPQTGSSSNATSGRGADLGGGGGTSGGDASDPGSSSYFSESVQDCALLATPGGRGGGGPATPELLPPLKGFTDDPRLNDPYLRKFFFRQRVTSHSRHPNIHYHCPLIEQDPLICAKYRCNLATGGQSTDQPQEATTQATVVARPSTTSWGHHKPHRQGSRASGKAPPPPSAPAAAAVSIGHDVMDEGEERDNEGESDEYDEELERRVQRSGSIRESDYDNSENFFQNFDFFHPALFKQRQLREQRGRGSSSPGSSTLHNRTQAPEANTSGEGISAPSPNTPAIHMRSATMSGAEALERDFSTNSSSTDTGAWRHHLPGRSRSARSSAEKARGQSAGDLFDGSADPSGNIFSAQLTANVMMREEPARNCHPSDCSWVSSSSNSSSTQSLS